MSLKDNIDLIDIKIMDIISKNARTPFRNVAELVGISRAAVHLRVNRLMDMEVITGSGYHINPTKVDFKTCTYIGVHLEHGSLYERVANEIEKIEEVVECHFTTGKYAIFIKVYSRDNEHLKNVLNTKIQEIKGISSTETLISLEERFNREIPVILQSEIKSEKK